MSEAIGKIAAILEVLSFHKQEVVSSITDSAVSKRMMQFLRDSSVGLTSPVGMAVGAGTAVAATAAAYYAVSRPEQYKVPMDLDKQSIELEDGSRTSTLAPDGDLMEFLYEDARTTHEAFLRGLKISGYGPCLGARTGPSKEYEWISYQDVYNQAQAFGSGLMAEGIPAQNDIFIGIYSINRPEWVISEQACSMFSMVTVALYDTLGPDTCSYIISQTSMSVVICDRPEKTQQLLDRKEELPSLKLLVIIEPPSDHNIQTAKKCGVKLVSFAEVLENGKKDLKSPLPPSPSDLATICYTSGTTGDPKGAMLTHVNIMSNVSAIVLYASKAVGGLNSEDIAISYLPLAHVFERTVQTILFMHGARVGFFSGDVRQLTDDMQTLKPTVFPSVPRLLNRMYDKVLAGVSDSWVKSTLLQVAIAAKTKELENFIMRRDSVWDKLVFKRVQTLVGGNVRIVFTASAPLEQKVMNFTRCAFGCMVVEGYGQTESTAGLSFTLPGEYVAGHVGAPLCCNKVKLVDVEEMDYFAKDGKGEICAKGPNVFIGYYKNPEKTNEALDEDGWLHTGDIGQWLPNGSLKIIDRKKNIFKLSQGEYIAAEKIENVYTRSQFVAQAFIEGDSLQPCIMGIIVPDEETLVPWAKKQGLFLSFTELCQREDVKTMVLKDMNKVGKDMGLKGFELVKDIMLYPQLFSVENGLLTPTFKNKRPELRKRFRNDVQQLYEKLATSS